MPSRQNRKSTVIAVCGKGGVGKTSISAIIVKILSSSAENRVLAIDADPATGLASALGIDVLKTVDDIRNDLIQNVQTGQTGNQAELIAMLDYEFLSALEERDNLAFLAIGRPENEGCYCQVNNLLKDIIASMASNFDYVVIDGEAGIEQVNRRVMERVSHMILVSDASAKALNVAQNLKQVADTTIKYEKLGLILNRIRNEAERSQVRVPFELSTFGWIPEDDTIRSYDIDDKSILKIPECPAMHALQDCLTAIGLMNLGQLSARI
jgi:CO dehydrogenase maturation factor